MKLLGFARLGRISGQITALVIVSIIALHAIVTASFWLHRPDQPEQDRGPSPLAASVRLLGAAPADERPRLLADIARAFPHLRIEPVLHDVEPAADNADGHRLRGLQHALGGAYRIFPIKGDATAQRLGIVLPDGAVFAASAPPERRPPPFWGGPWMMTLLFAVISVTLLGVWAARALTAPLSSFAGAAESFSLNGAAEPLAD